MAQKKCFDDMWIIVTGGAGFIGSCVIRQLNDLGFEKNIIVVDDFKESIKWKNLYGKKYAEFLSRHEFMQWLRGKESDVEAVIHMGAISSTTGKDGSEYYRLNYRYTVDLAKVCIENEIRFIYASSAATYGDGTCGFSDHPSNIKNLKPLNIYGQTKQMFDSWVTMNQVLDQVVGLKFFNVYGPNEYHKGMMSSMIYHMYHQIKQNGKVELFKSNTPEYADGDQERDFIYVKDVVKIVCDFLFNDITGIYNVGSGIARSWNSIAKELFSILGQEEQIHYIPLPVGMQYQNYTCADMSSLDQLMERKTTPFSESLKDYIQNYLARGERW